MLLIDTMCSSRCFDCLLLVNQRTIVGTRKLRTIPKKPIKYSCGIFPTCDITYLHSRVSQTYITTNQWGIELSSNAFRDIRNEYRYGEGECSRNCQPSRK